ncbi:MAG: hypothetical protein Q9216_006733 [Gyalolechia sp. 2 TL-2023]
MADPPYLDDSYPECRYRSSMDHIQEVVDIAVDKCILCQSPLYDVGEGSAGITVSTVLGSTKYLGYALPFTASTSQRLDRQQVIAYYGEPGDGLPHKPVSVRLRPCPRRKCIHRGHRHLGLCFHKLCYDILKCQVAGPLHPALTTMQHLWRLGKATLWLHVPNSAPTIKKSAARLALSTVSSNNFRHIFSELDKRRDSHGLSRGCTDLYLFILRLPTELQRMHLFISPAIIFQQTKPLLQSLRDPSRASIDLTVPSTVFLGQILHRDLTYVSYLSDRRLSQSDRSIWRDTETVRLVVITDDVAIRDIKFLAKDEELGVGSHYASWAGIYFRSMQPRYNRTIRQDLFLRDLDFGEELQIVPAVNNIIEWDTPEAPGLDPRHCYLGYKPQPYRRPLRMKSMPLEAGTRGIIAAQDSHGILALYAWHPNADIGKIYEDQLYFIYRVGSNARPTWTFFPMRAEEQVLDIFVREHEPRMTVAGPALVVQPTLLHIHTDMLTVDKVRTTAGRSYTFGSHIPGSSQHYIRFVPLKSRADGVVSGLYFNAVGPEHEAIYDLAITCRPHPDIHLAWTRPMQPGLPDLPDEVTRRRWYATSASLNDIAQIQVCRDVPVEGRCCIGLLIYYNDGSCESVGQWRWDFEVDEFVSAQGSMLYLWFKMNDKNTRLLDLGLEASSSTDVSNLEDMRQKVPLRGTIVWCFSDDTVRLTFIP